MEQLFRLPLPINSHHGSSEQLGLCIWWLLQTVRPFISPSHCAGFPHVGVTFSGCALTQTIWNGLFILWSWILKCDMLHVIYQWCPRIHQAFAQLVFLFFKSYCPLSLVFLLAAKWGENWRTEKCRTLGKGMLLLTGMFRLSDRVIMSGLIRVILYYFKAMWATVF